MSSDVHARIHSFLQQRSVISLVAGEAVSSAHILKAGVVPFIRLEKKEGQQAEQGAFLYFLMKPVARHERLAPPAFQLCKGTRMTREREAWRDLRDGEEAGVEAEAVAVTALREGIEELGLRLEGIVKLLELGPYRFSSAKTGRKRHMWLFAAEMESMESFQPDAEVAPTTAERQWLSLAEFDIVGRNDHRYILRDIEARLRASYKE